MLPRPPGAAVGQVLFTVEASVARRAGAGEGGHVVGAGARAAGVAQALVHVAGASWAGETREAGAGKGAHAVSARATVQAWVCGQEKGSLVTYFAPISPV
uniref:Uncharacterized protein n=1 Tax=Piliocolobus tephrosceles TaxID=591936 RepID=A0A8C9LZ89_9PRIM